MPIIRFVGKTYPSCVNLSFSTPVASKMRITELGAPLDAAFKVQIDQSIVTVICEVNRVQKSDWGRLCACAYELARAAVDMLAFSMGWGITLVLERTETEDGRVEALHYADPSVSGLCTAFQPNPSPTDQTFADVHELILRDRSIMLALNDVVSTLESPFRTPVNCQRAIDAIARMISPTLGPKEDVPRWRNMHSALNLSRSYLEPITTHSKGPRHGSYWDYPSHLDQDIRQRTWNVMNRFLLYRKRGGIPLCEPEFLQLT